MAGVQSPEVGDGLLGVGLPLGIGCEVAETGVLDQRSPERSPWTGGICLGLERGADKGFDTVVSQFICVHTLDQFCQGGVARWTSGEAGGPSQKEDGFVGRPIDFG